MVTKTGIKINGGRRLLYLLVAIAPLSDSVIYGGTSPFTYNYDANSLPDDPSTNPQWTKVLDSANSGGTTSETVSNGILTLNTKAVTDYLDYRIAGGPGQAWNATGQGTTLEMRLKTDFNSPGADWAGSFVLATQSEDWVIGIGQNFISDFVGPHGDLGITTNDAFHTYRFVVSDEANGPLSLYVDGSALPAKSWAGAPSSSNLIDFGDVTASNEGGQVEWDYLRWTNQAAIAPARPVVTSGQAGFGTQWLRQHPMAVMGEVAGVTPSGAFNANQYLGMNFNTVFVSGNDSIAPAAASAGIDWQMQYNIQPSQTLSDADKTEISYLISKGHATAWYLPDEPAQADFPNLASYARWMNAAHPDVMVYANVSESDSAYLNNLLTTVKPDLLMFDAYPLKSNGSTDSNGWFSTLMNVRHASLAAKIPYGGWLQSFSESGLNLRTPSESDTRYNAFTLLTAGYTMLNYFTYDDGPGAVNKSTLIDQNGHPTAMYAYAASANKEYTTLGKTLRFLTSTDVRFVPGQHTVVGSITASNSTPTGLTNWSAGDDPHLVGVSVVSGQLGSDKSGLIGTFEDDSGQNYFMLTNLNHSASLSASAASLNFVLTFDSSINDVLQLDRTTGAEQVLNLTNHQLTWTLPGGTGDLFKYDVGDFKGHGWCMDASGDWNSDSNWGGGIPNAADATAVFGDVINSARTVYTDTPAKVGTLRFDSLNTYQIAGNGNLTLQVSNGAASINVVHGSHKINLPLVFASDTNISIASGAALTIGNPATINAGKTVTFNGNLLIQAPLTVQTGGQLVIGSGSASLFSAPSLDTGAAINVKSNAVSINYSGQSDPSATIRGQLASGFAGGAWNGAGINSSSTIAGKTAVGWKDDPTSQSITVKYTFSGDTNLDGSVDSADFDALAADFGASSGVWVSGDFNYDGIVNALDFNALAGNYGSVLPATLPAPAVAAAFGTVVPEPASISAIALGFAMVALRRHGR